MKKGLTIMLAAFFLVLMLGGSSQAAPIQGAVYYGVDDYSYSPHNLQYYEGNAPASAFLGGKFTVNALNFTTEGGNSTYTQFLSNGGANGLVWADADSQTFGDNNNIQTDGKYSSFFQFSGWAWFSADFSIMKDDGFVLYINGYERMYDASYPTGPLDVSMSLFNHFGLDPGYYYFVLNYAAWNGFPEVLQITSGVTVPEPTTMLLFGLGMLGVAVIRRK